MESPSSPSQLPPCQQVEELHQEHLTDDTFGLFDQPVSPFHIVVDPELRCTLQFPRIHIEAAAQPHIERRVPGLHPVHQKLLRSEEHTSELQSRGQLVCRVRLSNKEGLSP